MTRSLVVALVGHSVMGAVRAHRWPVDPRFFDLGQTPNTIPATTHTHTVEEHFGAFSSAHLSSGVPRHGTRRAQQRL